MATILFLWTMVAAGSGGREYKDWRALAEFSSPAACERAIAQLGIPKDNARCLPK